MMKTMNIQISRSGLLLVTVMLILFGWSYAVNADELTWPRDLEVADAQGLMEGKTICGLADGTAWSARTFVNKFRSEFEAMINTKETVAV